MISVSTTSGPALAETFVYDGDGNRVSQTINGVTTNFLVDTNNLTGYAQVLEEIQGSTIQKAYTYGVSRISQDVFNGSGYTTNYFGYDGQGSVRFLMDSTGNVTDQYTYTSFGENLFTSGSTSNTFQYDGEQVEGNTGFYNLRARWMNPGVGRFETMDAYEGTIDDPYSLQKFLFVEDDPINKVDPSGNQYGPRISDLLKGIPLLNSRTFYNQLSGLGELFIKSWEQFRPYPYDSSGGGDTTIGWGHYLHHGSLTILEKTEKLLHINWITRTQGQEIFENDVFGVDNDVNSAVYVPLFPYEFDALASLRFNMKPSSFKNTDVVRDLNNGDYIRASWDFLLISKSNGVILPGLLSRRFAEIAVFKYGNYVLH